MTKNSNGLISVNENKNTEAFSEWENFLNWLASSKNLPDSLLSYNVEKLLENITLTAQQKDIVLNNSKVLLVKGSAGSGKSLALLSKMIKDMLEEKERYLYVTYNEKLIYEVYHKFSNSPHYEEITANYKVKEDYEFNTFHFLAEKILKKIGVAVPGFNTSFKELKKSEDLMRRQLYRTLSALEKEEFSEMPALNKIKQDQNVEFLREEFLWMKANNYLTEESYIQCERKGRGNLPWISRDQRRTIFKLFEIYLDEQINVYHGRMDAEDYALKLIENIDKIPSELKYKRIFVDEVQDFQPMQIHALTLLASDSITFCGDDKQKIYKNSLVDLTSFGVSAEEIETYRLKKVFRSTEQIMNLANSLHIEDRKTKKNNELYNKNGELPRIVHFQDYRTQIDFVIKKIQGIKKRNKNETITIVHRFEESKDLVSLRNELGKHFHVKKPDFKGGDGSGSHVYLSDAHSVKGLEFDHVFVINFSKTNYPLKSEMNLLKQYKSDSSRSFQYSEDLNEIIRREKRILYVVLTRARISVTLTYSGQSEESVSPFVNDFLPEHYSTQNF